MGGSSGAALSDGSTTGGAPQKLTVTSSPGSREPLGLTPVTIPSLWSPGLAISRPSPRRPSEVSSALTWLTLRPR